MVDLFFLLQHMQFRFGKQLVELFVAGELIQISFRLELEFQNFVSSISHVMRKMEKILVNFKLGQEVAIPLGCKKNQAQEIFGLHKRIVAKRFP